MDETVSAEVEHRAWVRIQCLQVACKVIPSSSAEAQVTLAATYEQYVMQDLINGEAMH